ncbi:MAG: hypothetical protein HUJ68_00160 [Clostridia bacterium]|nr:hypothetical protein [Clostridia bacterium]
MADGFCALCPKQYRVVVAGNPYPVKYACAGCKKDEIGKVENIDYNYDLGENKKYNIRKTQLKDDIYGKTI